MVSTVSQAFVLHKQYKGSALMHENSTQTQRVCGQRQANCGGLLAKLVVEWICMSTNDQAVM